MDGSWEELGRPTGRVRVGDVESMMDITRKKGRPGLRRELGPDEFIDDFGVVRLDADLRRAAERVVLADGVCGRKNMSSSSMGRPLVVTGSCKKICGGGGGKDARGRDATSSYERTV